MATRMHALRQYGAIAGTAAILLCGAQAANAADFTFNVPLEFTNLPDEVTSVKAECGITTLSDGAMISRADGIVYDNGNALVGRNSRQADVSNGAVSTSVQIAVDYGQNVSHDVSGNSASGVRAWACVAQLCSKVTNNCGVMNAQSPTPAFRPKTGTTPALQVTGTF